MNRKLLDVGSCGVGARCSIGSGGELGGWSAAAVVGFVVVLLLPALWLWRLFLTLSWRLSHAPCVNEAVVLSRNGNYNKTIVIHWPDQCVTDLATVGKGWCTTNGRRYFTKLRGYCSQCSQKMLYGRLLKQPEHYIQRPSIRTLRKTYRTLSRVEEPPQTAVVHPCRRKICVV